MVIEPTLVKDPTSPLQAHKLLLQEINQLIGIELLMSNFLESFIS